MDTPKRESKRLRLSKVKQEEEVTPPSAVTPDAAPSSNATLSSSSRPSPQECQWVIHVLSKLHPEVVERNNTLRRQQAASCGAQDTVVDGVVATMLSQNTTSANSTAAFRNLKQVFPTWNEYMETENNVVKLQEAIHVGGLAEIKANRIHEMLTTLQQERGSPSLEYLWELSNDKIKVELGRFKGLGPKTISCVLLFTLGRAEFPVDTHVHRISKQQKWISPSLNAEKTYLYLNQVVPDELKLDLHCLLIAHGKSCYRCAARGKPQFPPAVRVPCPLVQDYKEQQQQHFVVIKKEIVVKKE